MAYEAIIAPITEVLSHPNSTNGLLLVRIAGSQVITTIPYNVGDLACFFAEGGALEHEYLYENSEYRYSTTLEANVRENKNPEKSGLFDENGRVRSIKLRGEISEGYIAPLSSFAYTGFDFSNIQGGWTFTELNGHKICDRYISPAQKRVIEQNALKAKESKSKQRKLIVQAPTFLEHYDTQQLKHAYHHIPQDALILVTEKLHGTSGRTGHLRVTREVALPFWKKALVKLNGFIGSIIFGNNPFSELLNPVHLTTDQYETISGSRRVAYLKAVTDSYYRDTTFREKIHKELEGRLLPGETLYYEIVGYQAPNSPLFYHNVKKDNVGNDIIKKYGTFLRAAQMDYSYGCNRELGEFKIYIYRITHTNDLGTTIDLGYEQRIARCNVLGIPHVPKIYYGFVSELTRNGTLNLLEVIEELAARPSNLSNQHISEGVCTEITHPNMMRTFKAKNFAFRYLEGIVKDDSNYIDIEEVS